MRRIIIDVVVCFYYFIFDRGGGYMKRGECICFCLLFIFFLIVIFIVDKNKIVIFIFYVFLLEKNFMYFKLC